MSLAITADVRRWLDQDEDSAPGTVLQPFLDDATEEIKRITGRDWDASGAVTETFPAVRQGDLLTLRDENPTGLTVTAYLSAADSGLLQPFTALGPGLRMGINFSDVFPVACF